MKVRIFPVKNTAGENERSSCSVSLFVFVLRNTEMNGRPFSSYTFNVQSLTV